VLNEILTAEIPLVGVEPSAVLSFRDEYLKLTPDARSFQDHIFTFEEFLVKELKAGRIDQSLFTSEHKQIKVHVHCHQKALSDVAFTKEALSIPQNYHIEVLPTGCCGMAGSFGYEKEHYEVSMQIGELVLFPALRKAEAHETICAPGTSCRHQIFDGTQKTALHPAEILWEALA
jgi:Fe-S oxidoreductase